VYELGVQERAQNYIFRFGRKPDVTKAKKRKVFQNEL
jgi:hypothetical protein